MASIPGIINGVTIELSPTAIGTQVDQTLVNALDFCIKQDLVPGYKLNRLYISSAHDSHNYPSRHSVGKAVDISRINGKYILGGYMSSMEVKTIVDSIQEEFERFSQKRENLGPHLKLKLGNPFSIGGHDDHIHLSVN